MTGYWRRSGPELQEGQPAKTEQTRGSGATPEPQSTWSLQVFDDIEWRRFEALCEALFAQAGVRTESQSHGADGGIDIWLYSANSPKPMIVQCKHWRSKPVGVQQMREFFGVLKSHDLQYGTFATSSIFTTEALTFAKANGINAQDRHGLLQLIARRTPEQQAALLAVAYDGDYWRPTCVKCGVKMVQRQPKDGGTPFWGCANFAKLRCMNKMQMLSGTRNEAPG
jgi:restriction system protein